VARAPHIMVVFGELKWHRSNTHFNKHLLCIGIKYKTSTNPHSSIQEKNKGKGRGGAAIYIGPAHWSQFGTQTGTKGGAAAAAGRIAL
jgi:hypothetical protein